MDLPGECCRVNNMFFSQESNHVEVVDGSISNVRKYYYHSVRQTPFETFCAKAAIAILNEDPEARSTLQENYHFESVRALEDVASVKASLKDFSSVEEIDPFGTWFMTVSGREITRIRPVFARWVDSWIDSGHSLAQWTQREQFTAVIRRRTPYAYQDFFDHRDGRVRIAFYTSKRERPAELALWLFTLLITGPYARRIGKCVKCGRYCLTNRKGRFECGLKCTRHLSSNASKKKTCAADRARKDTVIQRTMDARPRRKDETERAWKERLLASLRRDEIKSKYLTQYLNRQTIPAPSRSTRGSLKRHSGLGAPTKSTRR